MVLVVLWFYLSNDFRITQSILNNIYRYIWALVFHCLPSLSHTYIDNNTKCNHWTIKLESGYARMTVQICCWFFNKIFENLSRIRTDCNSHLQVQFIQPFIQFSWKTNLIIQNNIEDTNKRLKIFVYSCFYSSISTNFLAVK